VAHDAPEEELAATLKPDRILRKIARFATAAVCRRHGIPSVAA
jgi:hypothetical protein